MRITPEGEYYLTPEEFNSIQEINFDGRIQYRFVPIKTKPRLKEIMNKEDLLKYLILIGDSKKISTHLNINYYTIRNLCKKYFDTTSREKILEKENINFNQYQN